MSIKLAKRQHTTLYESSSFNTNERFSKLLSLIFGVRQYVKSSIDLLVDAESSCPVGNTECSWSLRLTETVVGQFLHLKTSPVKISYLGQESQADSFINIGILISGEMRLITRSGVQKISAGSFYVRSAASPATMVYADGTEIFFLLIPVTYFRFHTGSIPFIYADYVFDADDELSRIFRNVAFLTDEMFNRIDARDCPDLVAGLLSFLRPVLRQFVRESGVDLRGSDLHLKNARDIMEKLASTPSVSVEEIARQSGVSVRYLSQLFREVGTTPAQELQSIRIGRAAAELRESSGKDLPLSEIAMHNGFLSLSHFSRVFHKMMGMTPSQWRSSRSATDTVL